jgi:Ca2+-binding RTX toxin-like protein
MLRDAASFFRRPFSSQAVPPGGRSIRRSWRRRPMGRSWRALRLEALEDRTLLAGDFLAITSQPPETVTTGDPFGLAVQVDTSSGTPDSTYSGKVVVTIESGTGPTGANLLGTTTVDINNGSAIAQFTNLMVNQPGAASATPPTDYVLKISADKLSSVTTNPVDAATVSVLGAAYSSQSTSLSFTIAVAGAALPQSVPVSLYWSSGTGFATSQTVELPAGTGSNYAWNTIAAGTPPGEYTETVPASILVGSPANAQDLLVVLGDPGSSGFNPFTDVWSMSLTLNVTPVSQGTGQSPDGLSWAGQALGYSTTANIQQGGCLLTSLDMALNAAGVVTNPYDLNKELKDGVVLPEGAAKTYGYLPNTGFVDPGPATSVAENVAGVSGLTFHTPDFGSPGQQQTVSPTFQTLRDLLTSTGAPIIVKVANPHTQATETSSGSNAISGLNLKGLSVGEPVSDTLSGVIPAGTTIEEIDSATDTVYLSNNATSTELSTTLVFFSTHFVLVTGLDGNGSFVINDPGNQANHSLNYFTAFNFASRGVASQALSDYGISILGYVKDPADDSAMYIAEESSSDDVSLAVTDGDGDVTGPVTPGSSPGDQIPNSYYFDEGSVEGSGDPTTLQIVYIYQPGDQKYTIASDGSGDYTLETDGESVSGQPTPATIFTASVSSLEPDDVIADSTYGQITFAQLTPEVNITANAAVYSGEPDAASATITDSDGNTGTTLDGLGLQLTYYSGDTINGTGSVTAPTDAGTYTVVAMFPGSSDYTSSSAQATFTISPPASTVPLQPVLDSFDSALGDLGRSSSVSALVAQGLGMNGVNLPLVDISLDDALDISTDLLSPLESAFQVVSHALSEHAAATWSAVAADLEAAGFTVPVQFTGAPDGNGNLVEIAFNQTVNLEAVPMLISGSTGFSYLDGAGGGLFGVISGAGWVSISLSFGVDINSQHQLGFFVVPNANAIAATVTASTGSQGLGGSLEIGDLADVSATATGGISVTGALGLIAPATDKDKKIRLADLTSNLGQAVTGSVSGSANLSVDFDAELSGLPDIPWSGTFSEDLVKGVLQSPIVSLQEPSASTLLEKWGASLFSIGADMPGLGPLADSLNHPLPLIGESISQLTGLDKDLPKPPSLPINFSDLNGVYDDVSGGTLTVNVTTASIQQFLAGQPVNLVSWEASGDFDLIDQNITVPIFSLGVPDIASVDIDATFSIDASLHYDFGFGLDGEGIWLMAGNAADPNLGLTFSVNAGVEGQVEVLGFPLAEAGGEIGFGITPYVTLTAPPWAADHAKVYLSDLALFGSDPVSDIADDLSYGINGAFDGEVYASIDLLLFSVSWSWGVSIPVFDDDYAPNWPAQAAAGHGGVPGLFDSQVTQKGGVVTFTGTSHNDNLILTQGSPGSLTIQWVGVGTKTYTGVTQFDLIGDGGNERLTTGPGVTIPIDAKLNGSADYVAGGAGNDTLVAGAGQDTLVAGTGNDSIVGGKGTDMLIGGAGKDTIVAGSGTDSIFGGSGNSTIDGGSGSDSIYAGSGNDDILGTSGTYLINGGSGTDTIAAGMGSHDTIYGGTGGGNSITASAGGYDLIYGGGPGDTISGGTGGHDTIYGNGGDYAGALTNNVIYGGTGGYNLIYGGGTGDRLYGAADIPGAGAEPLATYGGNNTIYGGSGNETIYGGDGQGLANPSIGGNWPSAGDSEQPGGNLLVAGNGNDVLFSDAYGHNTLVAGAGNDVLWAGGAGFQRDGDYLAAGTGVDSLYGGLSSDTFQMQFTTTGQEPDVVVGGTGTNSLILKPDAVSTPQLAQNISATATTIFVTNAATLAGPGASNFVIDVDNEQMMVTDVTGDKLTVMRGYNHTTAAIHSAGGAVVVEKPTLVDPGSTPASPTSTLIVPDPTLAEPVTDATSNSVMITDADALSPAGVTNFVIQVDSEQMLVTAITGNVLTVERGYSHTTATTHLAGTAVTALFPLAIDPTIAATTITVANAATLASAGTSNFVIGIDQEQMLVTNVMGNTLTVVRGYNDTPITAHYAGATVSVLPTLASALTSTSATVTVTDSAGINPANSYDPIIQIDSEQMLVTAASGNTLTVIRGFNNTVSAAHAINANITIAGAPVLDPTTSTISVVNASALAAVNASGFIIRIDQEQMRVTAVNLATGTLTVDRGYNSTAESSHAVGSPLLLQTADLPAPGDYELYLTQGATTQQGNTLAGSTTITGLDTANLVRGELVTGPGIPAGTTIAALASGSSITITAAATATADSISLGFGTAGTQRGSITSGSSTVSGLTTAFLVVGDPVSGAGIASGTTVASIVSPGVVTLSTPATATAAGVILTFGVFQATQYDLDTGGFLGQVNFAMPPGVSNVALEGGPGNNLIEVDPGVTLDTYIFGGPGNNTLVAGSGNDTLAAGSGASLLEGGSGDDVLYGGEIPVQNAAPVLNTSQNESSTWTGRTGDLTVGSATITNVNTVGLYVGEDVSGLGIRSGTVIAGISAGGNALALSQPVEPLAAGEDTGQSTVSYDSAALAFGANLTDGHDTLIAGSGNSELFAGNGGDVLIGGSADLVPNQQVSTLAAAMTISTANITAANASAITLSGGSPYIIQIDNEKMLVIAVSENSVTVTRGYDGTTPTAHSLNAIVFEDGYQAAGPAGRDLLVGGDGHDLLIAAPGSPGAMMFAGSGEDTLVAENVAPDFMQGGSGDDLILGGSLDNVITAGSLSGNDTLVGGYGANDLVGGSGNDSLYAYPDATVWHQAVTAAAVTPFPNVVLTYPSSPVAPTAASGTQQGQIDTLLYDQQTQTGGLTGTQLTSLRPLLNAAFAQDLLGNSSGNETIGDEIVILQNVIQTQNSEDGQGETVVQRAVLTYLQSLTSTTLIGDEVASLLQPGAITTESQGLGLAYLLELDQPIDSAISSILLDLQDNQANGLASSQSALLEYVFQAEFDELYLEDSSLSRQIEQTFVGATSSAEQIQLSFLTSADNAILAERQIVNDYLGGLPADSLVAGSGTDSLYGNPTLPTWMIGDTTAVPTSTSPEIVTFYNYHTDDTVQGGNGRNTILIEGDGSFTISSDNNSSDSEAANAVVITLTSAQGGKTQQWLLGDIGHPDGDITGVQFIGVQTGNADGDTVDLSLNTDSSGETSLPPGLTGLKVQLGNGNRDVIDASDDTSAATLLAGTGADTIRVSTKIGAGTEYQGNALSELDIVGSGDDTVLLTEGVLTVDSLPVSFNSQTGTTTSGSATITNLSDLAVLSRNQLISGNGIPLGTTIVSIDANTDSITISQPVQNPGSSPVETNVVLSFGMTFKTLKVIGGPGTNLFTADGSIPNVILQGGSSPGTVNNFVGQISPLVQTSPVPHVNILGSAQAVNTLTIKPAPGDNSNTTVSIYQPPGPNPAVGTILAYSDSPAEPFSVTATNIYEVTLVGGAGNDYLDASGTTVPVTLEGASPQQLADGKAGADMLIPGQGTNFLYYGKGQTYGLESGANANWLVIPAATTLAAPIDSATVSTITVAITADIAANDIIAVNDELMYVTGVVTNLTYQTLALTVLRDFPGSYEAGPHGTGSSQTPTHVYVIPSAVLFGGTTSDLGANITQWETEFFIGEVNIEGKVPSNYSLAWTQYNSVLVSADDPTTLTLGFVDTNPNGITGFNTPNGYDFNYLEAVINWGDGATSTNIGGEGAVYNVPDSWSLFDSHVYNVYGTYQISITVIDKQSGQSITANTTVTAGLELSDANGDLIDGANPTGPPVDTNVQAYLVENVGNERNAIYSLHNDDSLWAIDQGSQALPTSQIDNDVESDFLGEPIGAGQTDALWVLDQDGTLNVLEFGGGLVAYESNVSESEVQAVIEDAEGNYYQLAGDPTLYVNTPTAAGNIDSQSWTSVEQNVRSTAPDPSGIGVDVMDNDGTYWYANGTDVTLLTGPHLSVAVLGSSTVTAGQPVQVKVQVLDALNELVPDYDGTVNLTTSAPASDSRLVHTFAPADAGQYTFSVTFGTAGTQTISATDSASGAAGAPVSVNINPAPAAYLRISSSSSSIAVGGSLPVTVTAYDGYGNIASGYSGVVNLTSTTGLDLSYTFTSSAGGDDGTHTFYVTFDTVGSDTITAVDAGNGSVSGSRSLVVEPSPVNPAQSVVSVSLKSLTYGTAATAVLTARDVQGNQEARGGLSVAFSCAGGIFGPVTDNGNGTYTAILTGTAVGSFPIQASVNGQSVTGSLPSVTVAPAALIIEPNSGELPGSDQSMVYGSTMPVLGYTAIGFVNHDSSALLIGTLGTTAISTSGVGTYNFTLGSLSAGPDYALTLSASAPHFDVTKATPTFGNLSAPVISYGTGSTVISGWLQANVGQQVGPSGDTIDVTIDRQVETGIVNANHEFSVTFPTATLISASSPYSIEFGYEADTNFASASGVSVLTVNKASLTVTVNPESLEYGQAIPKVTYSISGFVNADNANVVSGAPILATTATSSSAAGSYAILIGLGSLAAANYDFPNLVGGTLTILPPVITTTPPPPLVTTTTVHEVSNKKHQVTEVVITFSGAVNAAEADLVGTYRLATPGAKHSYTAKNAGIIRLKSAMLNQANNTLTLTFKKPITITKPVQLLIYGTGADGLRDIDGRLIDGDHNGQPGGNVTAILSRKSVAFNAIVHAEKQIRVRQAARSDAIDALLERGDMADHRTSRGTW